MGQLIFFLFNLYIQMLGLAIKVLIWLVRNPGLWLISHPFQLSFGILASYLVFHSPLMLNSSGVVIMGFMLGASVAHLLDQTVLADAMSIRAIAFPMVGLAAGLTFTNLVEPLLQAAIAVSLVFGCNHQARA